MTKKLVNIGTLIDSMAAKRNELRELAAKEKELRAQFDELETSLLEQMEAQGVVKSTGKNATASVSTTVQFQFDGEDGFEKFMTFVARHKYFHLVQRRVSAPAARELFEKKGVVPGLMPYTKKEISLLLTSK